VNIREVIEQLTAEAENLPVGLDTEVRVVMCDGTDAEITRIFEIDNMAALSEDGSITDVFLIVKGHPHLDETSIVVHGVMQDADEHLRRWAEEDPPKGATE
jgi:hypothetical protein